MKAITPLLVEFYVLYSEMLSSYLFYMYWCFYIGPKIFQFVPHLHSPKRYSADKHTSYWTALTVGDTLTQFRFYAGLKKRGDKHFLFFETNMIMTKRQNVNFSELCSNYIFIIRLIVPLNIH